MKKRICVVYIDGDRVIVDIDDSLSNAELSRTISSMVLIAVERGVTELPSASLSTIIPLQGDPLARPIDIRN